MTVFESPAPPNGRTYRLLARPTGQRSILSAATYDGRATTEDASFVLVGSPFADLGAALRAMQTIEDARQRTNTSMWIGVYQEETWLMWIFESKRGDQ